MYFTNWHLTVGHIWWQDAKDSGEQMEAKAGLVGQLARQVEASGSALDTLYSASLQEERERATARNHTATNTCSMRATTFESNLFRENNLKKEREKWEEQSRTELSHCL